MHKGQGQVNIVEVCHVALTISLIYTASKVKHHPNIFLVTVFMYDFLQKNNKFVIYCNTIILSLSHLSECHLILC